MRKSITFISATFAVVIVAGGCSSGSSDGAGAGIACAQDRCGEGQVCCIDCDGHGTCGAPGSVCVGSACGADSGIGGASGFQCGNRTCAAGQVCCLDCDSSGTCGPPGSVCRGTNCTFDAGSGGSSTGGASTGGASAGGASTGGAGGAGEACGSTVCATGFRCCDHCVSQCVSALSGQNCPDDNDPARTCACGHTGENCCQAGLLQCESGLMCCTGLPYPAAGTCAAECTLKSDYNVKTDFSPIAASQVLDRLDALPITTWRYTEDRDGGRHMGPMAQEFRDAFGLGASDTTIQVVDGLGVSMAAIQALSRELKTLEGDNAALKKRISSLEARCSK